MFFRSKAFTQALLESLTKAQDLMLRILAYKDKRTNIQTIDWKNLTKLN